MSLSILKLNCLNHAPSEARFSFVLVHFLSALCDQVTMMRNARVVRPQVAIWDILVVGPWTKNRLWQALFCVSEREKGANTTR